MGNEQESAPQNVGVVAREACFCVGVFFVLMLLFNGVAMYRSASHLEYGTTRDFWMAVLRPIDCISRVSRFYLLRDFTQANAGEWLNRANKE